MEKANYNKLAFAQLLSFIIMYGVMFANVNATDNIYISLNRFYMTLLMVAPMTILMILIMSSMFKNKKLNSIIIGSAIAVIVLAFVLLRNQIFVEDKGFMNAMIPHHSSAILVSENASISDPELKELAREIIEAQKEEIAQMKRILARMDKE